MEEVLNPDQAHWVVQAFHEGGPAMYFIAAVGVMVVLLIIERFLTLRALTVDKQELKDNLFHMILKGDVKQAITYCDRRPAPLTNTMKAGLVQVVNKAEDEEVQVAMDASVLKETPRLEGWTGFLAVFGNVATLIGLFGTIVGLIGAFGGVSEADPAQKAAKLSAGISEALNCTAFGLIVAIVAILAYGYFQIRVSRATNDMVEGSMSLMNLVVSNRDKIQTEQKS